MATKVGQIQKLNVIQPIFIQGKCVFIQPTAPLTRPDTTSLISGDVWFDTSTFIPKMWNGSVWSAQSGGTTYQLSNGIVQSKTTVDNPVTARSTTSTTYTSTGISATLTNNLQSASSRVRIRFLGIYSASVNVTKVEFTVFRGSTNLLPANTTMLAGGYIQDAAYSTAVAFEIEDTPGTVTPATYTIQWKVSGNTGYLGRRGGATDPSAPSVLAVEELVDSVSPIATNTFQPLDSDLTAIAALSTTSFGRSFLTLADVAATQTALSLVPGTNVQAYNARLAEIAGLTPATNQFIGCTVAGSFALRTIGSLAGSVGIATGAISGSNFIMQRLNSASSALTIALNGSNTGQTDFTLNSRLQAIAAQANPAVTQLFQLNTDGSVTFVNTSGFQASNSKLTSIANFANPATVKSFQLNTDGSVTLVDPASGGGSSAYRQAFTNADLASGILTVTHNRNQQFVGVHVADSNNKLFPILDEITFTSSTQLTIDFTQYVAANGSLVGTWNLLIFG